MDQPTSVKGLDKKPTEKNENSLPAQGSPREKPLRSKSGGGYRPQSSQSQMEFKSSFGMNKYTTGTTGPTDAYGSRFNHQYGNQDKYTLGSPQKVKARSISPLRASPSRNQWHFESIGTRQMAENQQKDFYNAFKQKYNITETKFQSPSRNTVTEIKSYQAGMHNTLRDSPQRVGMRLASYSNLPPMPPSLVTGPDHVIEHHHSPARAHGVMVEHRVHRSPLREVFVQERHHSSMGAVRMSGPPPGVHFQSHVVMRYPPEHH